MRQNWSRRIAWYKWLYFICRSREDWYEEWKGVRWKIVYISYHTANSFNDLLDSERWLLDGFTEDLQDIVKRDTEARPFG